MVGYVQEAIANALREWPTLKDANVMVIRATEEARIVVNTNLPAIAIQINGTDGHGNTYIGGGIRQYFELVLHVILPITNFTFSKDRNLQAYTLDMSDEVIRCIEQTELLNDLKIKHDFNAQFDRMETETTNGTKGAISIVVDVHKVIYACDVQFDPKDEAYNRYVELKKVIIDNNGINKSVIE